LEFTGGYKWQHEGYETTNSPLYFRFPRREQSNTSGVDKDVIVAAKA